MATDSVACEILKRKIKKLVDITDYPLKPVIPRYMGKVDNFRKQTMSPGSRNSSLTTISPPAKNNNKKSSDGSRR